jgi:hypothetical protein
MEQSIAVRSCGIYQVETPLGGVRQRRGEVPINCNPVKRTYRRRAE